MTRIEAVYHSSIILELKSGLGSDGIRTCHKKHIARKLFASEGRTHQSIERVATAAVRPTELVRQTACAEEGTQRRPFLGLYPALRAPFC